MITLQLVRTLFSELGGALTAFEVKMAELSVSKRELVQQLFDLGVKPGVVLLVHTSFSKVKPVGSMVISICEEGL